ncbi:uncharacterized protein B0H64DRAFT_454909 [Chaetomium fimeti]|uniref:Phospholipase/carboxylesterase/thioesterase domain-containing protein n=1 Tax=Chaetomium fimeti TaxID=1854472 RepID=A0AAE0LVS3_9PEZI|nr:hypothetical protein B0H64DRAFT_454909 [Chaetomium fimeti]
MPPTRIPTEEDFASIFPSHPTFPATQTSPISLVYPNPRESTTSILLLLHGLGDSEAPFTTFARNLSLPGVLSISIRGTAPLPALLTSTNNPNNQQQQGYHWGDDITFSSSSGQLDPDPGFATARRWITERLIGEVLLRRCGWEVGDVMVFGFGQGGSVALGLGSWLRRGGFEGSSEGASEGGGDGNGDGLGGRALKGVVSVGGGLPLSMVPPPVRGGGGVVGKAKTPVLVCCGRESEAVDADAEEVLEREFETVKVVRWNRSDDGMPRSRGEVLPMMQFFAERLRSGWL